MSINISTNAISEYRNYFHNKIKSAFKIAKINPKLAQLMLKELNVHLNSSSLPSNLKNRYSKKIQNRQSRFPKTIPFDRKEQLDSIKDVLNQLKEKQYLSNNEKIEYNNELKSIYILEEKGTFQLMQSAKEYAEIEKKYEEHVEFIKIFEECKEVIKKIPNTKDAVIVELLKYEALSEDVLKKVQKETFDDEKYQKYEQLLKNVLEESTKKYFSVKNSPEGHRVYTAICNNINKSTSQMQILNVDLLKTRLEQTTDQILINCKQIETHVKRFCHFNSSLLTRAQAKLEISKFIIVIKQLQLKFDEIYQNLQSVGSKELDKYLDQMQEFKNDVLKRNEANLQKINSDQTSTPSILEFPSCPQNQFFPSEQRKSSKPVYDEKTQLSLDTTRLRNEEISLILKKMREETDKMNRLKKLIEKEEVHSLERKEKMTDLYNSILQTFSSSFKAFKELLKSQTDRSANNADVITAIALKNAQLEGQADKILQEFKAVQQATRNLLSN